MTVNVYKNSLASNLVQPLLWLICKIANYFIQGGNVLSRFICFLFPLFCFFSGHNFTGSKEPPPVTIQKERRWKRRHWGNRDVYFREDTTWARVDMEYPFQCSIPDKNLNTRRDITTISTSSHLLFCSMYRPTDLNNLFDDFSTISDHFPKTSEDSPNFV